MLNRYSITAMILMLIVIGSYTMQFYFNLGYGVSDKASDWVDFSGYVGGLISPLLSFVSLVLLIQSLNLQNQANKELRKEVKLNRKNEELRSFESYFFGLIDAQRTSFANFNLDFSIQQGGKHLTGVVAIQELEDQILNIRNLDGTDDKDIEEVIEQLDQNENIFNAIRIFYNVVKMVSEKLTDEKDFDILTRKSQFQTLINFTEFSQLRLVMISMQFMDWESATYLKNNKEFMEVLKDLGGGADLY
jgi:hypothetical protein